MRTIKRHIVHCSATPDGQDYSAKDIDTWHKERGWYGIGYHFVIKRDGEIEKGRPLDEVGAHARGHNHDSIGTCLIGTRNFTADQFIALWNLHTMLGMVFEGIEPLGHRDVNPLKECPCFDAKAYLTGNSWQDMP